MLSISKSLQIIVPSSIRERFEGVGFSRSGSILGVATADNNTVLLFRRKTDSTFEDRPYCTLGGRSSGIHYPHDVSFSTREDCELLAVAQRRGAISIYGKNQSDDNYGPTPIFEISGAETKLSHSDGVAFVPPDDEYLAACNLVSGTISFYRRRSLSQLVFDSAPEFELKHRSMFHPDGLAFSSCGRWLAVANHGSHSVCIFQRRNGMLRRGKLRYGRRPIAIIEDPQFRYPHSVAFTPRTNHLLVTSAGANFFSGYAPTRGYLGVSWSQSPTLRKTVADEKTFRRINSQHKMEGGPKGIATHENLMAVCSPQVGLKLYSFHELLAG